MPKVSIILTTYNGEKYISQAIESVLKQSYSNFELIIVNDASPDNVEKIIEKHSSDSRIIYIKNKKNLNIARSRNKGIQSASGKYICFLDQDDFYSDQHKIEKQISFLEKNPIYGMVGTSVIFINSSGEELSRLHTRETDTEIRKHILSSSQFCCGSVMMRKSIVNKVGCLNPNYSKTDDYDLWLRIGRVSKFHNLQDYSFSYRIHSHNTTNSNIMTMKIMSLKLCIKNAKYYPNFIKSVLLWMVYIIIPHSFSSFLLDKFKRKAGVKTS